LSGSPETSVGGWLRASAHGIFGRRGRSNAGQRAGASTALALAVDTGWRGGVAWSCLHVFRPAFRALMLFLCMWQSVCTLVEVLGVRTVTLHCSAVYGGVLHSGTSVCRHVTVCHSMSQYEHSVYVTVCHSMSTACIVQYVTVCHSMSQYEHSMYIRTRLL